MQKSTNENPALNWMIEIKLKKPDDFLKIKETLTRIGISSEENTVPTLYPSCVILHKQGKYYLSHFKFMFMLDGKRANIGSLDIRRFRTIAHLLRTWGLCDFAYESDVILAEDNFNPKLVKIVPFSQKNKWNIVHKYDISGNKKPRGDHSYEYSDAE